MRVIDLNILLYAINADSHHHGSIRAWWEQTVNGDEPVGLAWAVLLGFLRIATNSRIFPNPLSVEQAIGKVDRWLSHPNIRIVPETEQHWHILKDLLEETGTAGSLTTDAHLAAIAISYGAALASCDSDFSRFQNLRLENPLRK